MEEEYVYDLGKGWQARIRRKWCWAFEDGTKL